MSTRIDKSWLVYRSIENHEHDRCVDLFLRPDGSHGFEEFRRDPEDAGIWTPVRYFSGIRHESEEDAMRSFVHGWLDVLGPVTVPHLAERSGLTEDHVTWGLLALEAAGVAMQGRYTPGTDSIEWCERGLLAYRGRARVGVRLSRCLQDKGSLRAVTGPGTCV